MRFFLILYLLFCNSLLVFSQQDLKVYEDYMPESKCGEVINYTHYSVSYCEKYKLSEWSIHYMTEERVFGDVDRTDNFRLDNKGRGASLSNYYKSGYDRGHMVPAGDMKFNQTAMNESFFLTNISPQNPSFNRGINKKIESKFREWVVFDFDTIIIITGFVMDEDLFNGFIGPDRIPIPSYSYKIFIDKINHRSLAFLVPMNKKIKGRMFDYIISIDELETIADIDFFEKMPLEEEILYEMDTNMDFDPESNLKGSMVEPSDFKKNNKKTAVPENGKKKVISPVDYNNYSKKYHCLEKNQDGIPCPRHTKGPNEKCWEHSKQNNIRDNEIE